MAGEPARESDWWWVGRLAIAAVGLCATHWPVAGRRADRSVDLAFPLRHGTYAVANGGSNELVSAHMQTLSAERFRSFRGQSYGVTSLKSARLDCVPLYLLRAIPVRTLFSGDDLFPCGGTCSRRGRVATCRCPKSTGSIWVATRFSGLQGREVLFGHMRRGSVRSNQETASQRGTLSGRSGTLGHQRAPFHIDAQRPAESDAFLSGEPLPIRLNGRFLVRKISFVSVSCAIPPDRPHWPVGFDAGTRTS